MLFESWLIILPPESLPTGLQWVPPVISMMSARPRRQSRRPSVVVLSHKTIRLDLPSRVAFLVGIEYRLGNGYVIRIEDAR